MRRFIPCWIVLAIALAAPAWADEGDSRARIVDIRRAPPPPVITDREEPHLAPVPNTTVRVADRGERDFDLFRYGVFWYIHRDGFWYRGRGFRGPVSGGEAPGPQRGPGGFGDGASVAGRLRPPG